MEHFSNADIEGGIGESMFFHEVPVYVGDLGSRVDEGTGINIFQGVQGYY